MVTVPPNYLFIPNLNKDSVVVDVGCADTPDFSMLMMDRFGCSAHGVDPTQRHQPALQEIERRYAGRFRAHCLAVSSTVGSIQFHESLDNLSGSVFDSHRNVRADRIRTYQVESVDLAGLPNRLGVDRVDMLKLDLEGAEFDLIAATTARDFEPFGQVFVEFHQGIVSKYSEGDVRAAIAKIESFGWAAHSVDQTNYLFYRRGK